MIPSALADILHDVGQTAARFPHANFADAFSRGQLESKLWAVEELAKLNLDLRNVFVMAGWYGVLPLLLFASNIPFRLIRSFDMDPECQTIADSMNRRQMIPEWKFKATTANILDLNYDRETFYITMNADGEPVGQRHWGHTIINTSCDHITDFAGWWSKIPRHRLVLLQNNDFAEGGDDHTNTVNSLEEFAAMAPMRHTLYRGERDFGRYRRFMLIGKT